MFARCLSVCVVLALALVICAAATAANLNVPGSYSSIQTAINGASTGDHVVVAAGTYHERINFNGKAITVRSTNPTDPAVVAATIIDADRGGSCVVFNHSETSASVITGFTLTDGSGTLDTGVPMGGGVYSLNASPTIAYNIISGNIATYGGGIACHNGAPTIAGNAINANDVVYCGGGIYSWSSYPVISNNTLSDNTAEYYGGGIQFQNVGGGSLVNNTLSGNRANGNWGGNVVVDLATVRILNNIITFAAFGGGVYITAGTPINFKYCDVYGNTGGNYRSTADQTGSNGNISVDPLFANAAAGDFHERAIGGRWNGVTWVGDAVTSPCVDAGDPTSAFANEPEPNGGRINMGAFGNTEWASKSGTLPPPTYIVSGRVTNGNGDGLPGVHLALGTTTTTTTDPDGYYSFFGLDEGSYSLTPTLADYTFSPVSTMVSVGPDATDKDFVASRRLYVISGKVTTPADVPVPGVTLAMGEQSAVSDAQGMYAFTDLLSGNYTIKPTLDGYGFSPVQRSLAIDPARGDVTDADFVATLPPFAPTVVSSAPQGTAASAEFPTISTTFSASMIRNSAQAAFTISPAKADYYQAGWPGEFSWLNNQMRFKLSCALAANTTYTVTIGTYAKSARGVHMETEYSWSFTTGSVPAVSAYAPQGTVPPSSCDRVTIRFNEAMNKPSVENALWIYPAGTPAGQSPTRPAGYFIWVGNEMRYFFTNELPPLTTYIVRLGKTAKAACRVSRTGPFVWSFTTIAVRSGPASVTVASAPTAAGAQIAVNLSAAANVTVQVRNLAGRPVATLYPGELTAGMHSLLWNGKSAQGTTAPAGTYLLDVQAKLASGAAVSAMASVALGR